jgi:hypothetical protein
MKPQAPPPCGKNSVESVVARSRLVGHAAIIWIDTPRFA